MARGEVEKLSRAGSKGLGMRVIRDGRMDLSTAEQLIVRPDQPVGNSATIHGLTDSDVAQGQSVEAAITRLLERLPGRILVVHFGGLDRALIDRYCHQQFGADLPMPVVDTLHLERRRQTRRHHVSGPGRLRLGDLREHYGLPRYGAHDALTDAIATGELLLAMIATHGSIRESVLRDIL